MYDITTLPQIQNSGTQTILTPQEFLTKYKYAPKLIKEALKQAAILFPNLHNTHNTHNHPSRHKHQ